MQQYTIILHGKLLRCDWETCGGERLDGIVIVHGQ